MAKDVIRIRLTDDQRATVAGEIGVELEELAYPDPGGELNARFPHLPPEDVLNWARAQAVVTAYENDRVAAREELEREQERLDAEADEAIARIRDARREAVEEKERMLAEADPKAKKPPVAKKPAAKKSPAKKKPASKKKPTKKKSR